MKRRNIIRAICVPAVLFLVSQLGAPSYGQDSESMVFFDCGDVGVEARRLMESLNEERLKLEKQHLSLERREEELKIIRSEVDNKISRLKELRERLEELLVQKDEVELEKVKKLSKIYQKRDPAEAAKNLASMEKELAVSILSMMRDKSAGKILDEMDEDTAVEYSTALGRVGDFKRK